MTVGALVLAGLTAATLLAPPQQRDSSAAPSLTIATGVAPETVTVGGRFRSFLRVRLPEGAHVELGAFATTDSLQLVDSIVSVPHGPVDDRGVAGVYPLVAWIAGEPLRQQVEVTVTLASGERLVYPVALRLPVVRSVLPGDDAELRPKPAKGLLASIGRRSPWWWLLLLPAAAAAAWLARRLLARTAGPAPRDLRAEALSRLDGLGEPGPGSGAEPYYTSVVRVLREYLAGIEGRLGEDLTTAELIARAGGPHLDSSGLAAVLHRADPVKFGGVASTPDEMRILRADVRRWIERNPAPAPERSKAA